MARDVIDSHSLISLISEKDFKTTPGRRKKWFTPRNAYDGFIGIIVCILVIFMIVSFFHHDTKAEGIHERIDDIEKNFLEPLKEKISSLESRNVNLSQSVIQLQGKLGDLETGFREKLSNSVEKLEGQLSNLEGHFNNVETELKANLSRNFQQLNGQLGDLETGLKANLSLSVQSLEGQMSNLETVFKSNLTQSVELLQGQLKKLKSGLQANLSHSVNVEPLHEMEGLTVSENIVERSPYVRRVSYSSGRSLHSTSLTSLGVVMVILSATVYKSTGLSGYNVQWPL